MDYINHRKKFSPFLNNESYFEQFPNIQPTETEKLHNSLFKSPQLRTENKLNEFNDQETFERLFKQTLGQDMSNITELTKDFERKTKRNF